MINSDIFTPFFGVVEDTDANDIKAGRYKVRVYGYNSDNKGILPTENLKFFSSGVSNSAGTSGIGHSPTGYRVGSFVFGFYIDKDKQEGIILCAFNGAPGGVTDVSPIATGEGGAYVEALKKGLATDVPDARGETWSEPVTKYAAQYPNNQVYQSASGHVIEYDDTPGAERITIFHKSGTFEEIHPDGKKVTKTTGESFDIHLGGHNIYVSGNLNAVVSGDYRLSVMGEYYVKAANVIFDTPNVDIYGISNANDHISSQVSGAYHVHDGVMPGPYYTDTPVGATTAFAPTPANVFNIQAEDTGYTPEVIQFGLENGFLTPEDVVKIQTDAPVLESIDETPRVEKKPQVVECGMAVVNGRIDYNAQLSPNVKLRDVSTNAVVSHYSIRAQGGYSEEEIICNLKNLAENVIEPLKAKYPNMIITSGFRTGSGRSQHERGEAIDVQFPGASKSFYYEAAQWCKANLPYDQFLLEYKSTGSGLPWLHFSLTRGKQRYQVMTFFNHRKYSDGLTKLS